jgi:hypothetical protein
MERKHRDAIARLSLIIPEVQKITDGKNRKAITAAVLALGKSLLIEVTTIQEHAKDMNEK